MADTLIRENIAFGSQPLSPVPQYWDGSASYEKVQGINGAVRCILFTSGGETFINSAPGTVSIVTSAGATNSFSNSNPAFIEIVSSSGGTAYFSGTNPGYTTKSTINRQTIFSSSGTFTSGSTATSDLTFNITGALTATFTSVAHEVLVTNDGPYDTTVSVLKVVSAGGTAGGTYYPLATNKFTALATTAIGSTTVAATLEQVQGLFNFNTGLRVVLTVTAAFTAEVTHHILIKEIDL